MIKNKNKLSCSTIGHSNHQVEQFIDLIKMHEVNYLFDVRSSPYSKYASQFNREILSLDLSDKNIKYVYAGGSLGGRYDDENLLFQDGKVNYNEVKKTRSFIEGISEVINIIGDGHVVALMCAEKDPLDCHRFVLISRYLEKEGVSVKHILSNGDIVSNEDLEQILLKKYDIEFSQLDMFKRNKTREIAIDEAYTRRNKEIAYSPGAREGQQT